MPPSNYAGENPVYQNGSFVVVAFRLKGVDFFGKPICLILRNQSFGVRETTGCETLSSAPLARGL